MRTLFCISTSLIGLCSALPAYAQDAASDIIVTARRTEERLQDVPISISVYTQQTLTERNINTASDLSTYTPSLASNTNFGTVNTTFAIRGFSQDNGTQPSVGVYFADVIAPRGASNGLPSGDGAAPGSFFDLQNVQILNGPQGTLFGRNTTGGAVLLVPQKPTGKFEGFVEGSFGNYDMKRISGVVNIPVMDTLRIRLGVDRQTRDGYLNNISGIGPKDFNDIDYTAFRASIVADLTPNLENYAIISYSQSNTSGPIEKIVAASDFGGPLLPFPGAPGGGTGPFAAAQQAREAGNFYNTGQNLPNAGQRFKQWQIVNTTTWRASDTLTIKNILSYAQLRQSINAPLFGTDLLVTAGGTTYHVPFAQVTTPPGEASADESTFTEELQIQGRTGNDKLTYQIGGYLEVASPLSTVGSQSAFLASCTDSKAFQCTDPLGATQLLGFAHLGAVNLTEGQTGFHNVGAYAQATYKFTDQLKLTGGIRYTWDHEWNWSSQKVFSPFFPPNYGIESVRCTNPVQAANPGASQATLANGCTNNYYVHSDKPTWLIDVDYTPTQDILLYAKYARGYRAGTIAPNVTAPFNVVTPESVDSFEVGGKTSWHGSSVRGTFNIAGFYNKLKNQQLQIGFNADPTSGLGSTAAPFNAGDAQIYGVEVQASISPFRGLDINGAYTYLHTKLENVQNVEAIALANNSPYNLAATFRNGDPEVLTPKNKFTITGTYTLPLDESIGKISVGATFTHRDSFLDNYSDRGISAAPFNPGTPSIASFSWLPPLDLLNLNASWNNVLGSSVDISAFATNVTKQKYYTYAASLGSPFTGFETAQVGEPRMYGFRLKYRFGS